ncbi:MAG: hypothetical protein ABH950_04725 [Candidatus Altiarchaeota archaeon]
MKIEIVSEQENPLLGRKEVKFTMSYSGATPKRDEIKKELVNKLSVKENLTILDHVKSIYGKQQVEGYVKAYKDKESMEIEPEHKIKRNFGQKEKDSDTPKPGSEKEAASASEEKTGQEKPKETSEKSEEEGSPPENKAEPEKPAKEESVKESSSDKPSEPEAKKEE